MIEFAWTENMSVGVPTLDADHRCIVRIINTLQDVDEENADCVVDRALDSLVAYCRYHFAREERVMRGCNFPALDFHKGEHEGFTRFVCDLRRRYARQTDGAIIDELRDYLARWLCHHILIQDMAFKPYVLAASNAGVFPNSSSPGDPDAEGMVALSG